MFTNAIRFGAHLYHSLIYSSQIPHLLLILSSWMATELNFLAKDAFIHVIIREEGEILIGEIRCV